MQQSIDIETHGNCESKNSRDTSKAKIDNNIASLLQ